ncbi:MAG TPA: hypothetical protein VIV06_03150 [Candidatus Limnocylindrales bacterium]
MNEPFVAIAGAALVLVFGLVMIVLDSVWDQRRERADARRRNQARRIR